MNKALFALSLGTFALGISEFVMMGILVNIADGLDVTITAAGRLISAYATGVCVGAVLLLMLRRMPLGSMMMMLAGVICAGNLLAAAAPGYHSMLAARFISGLPHGAYFGVGAIVARKLAAPGREVQAVSIMIAGMTVANLIGVPLGTWVAETVSWRIAFLAAGISGGVTLLLLRLWLPRFAPLPDSGRLSSQFSFLKTLPPWLIFGGVFIGQSGIYCWYSYIDPLLTRVSGFSYASLSWIMLLAGLGMFGGNLLAGPLARRFKPSLVAGCMQASALVLLPLISVFATNQPAMVALTFLCAAAMFGSGSPLQSSIVGYSRGGELLGAALIQIAYNAGNAIAAAVGGSVIAAGRGYTAPAIAGIPFVAVGSVLIFILYFRRERRG
ncbi:MAG: MFS transporter [Muribaculaceae bacterium]|nr:MFS transporter [Muribaculaceae bacterium]